MKIDDSAELREVCWKLVKSGGYHITNISYGSGGFYVSLTHTKSLHSVVASSYDIIEAFNKAIEKIESVIEPPEEVTRPDIKSPLPPK